MREVIEDDLFCLSVLGLFDSYEQLVSYYPEVDEYKLYLAQTYYKEGKLAL